MTRLDLPGELADSDHGAVRGVDRRRGASTRRLRTASLILGGVAAGVALTWAFRHTVAPAPLGSGSTPRSATATSSSGTLSSSFTLNVEALWPSTPAGANRAAGVVTEIADLHGRPVTAGTVLYRVAERPVVAASGTVPSFRTIEPADSGRDVRQLQQLLKDGAFYDGPLDGVMDGATVAATRAWQDSLGIDATGVVDRADVIYLPELPARVVLDAAVVRVGADLSGGEVVAKILGASPSFSLPVTGGQAQQIPDRARVVIAVGERQWVAQTGERTTGASGDSDSVTIALEPVRGSAICRAACSAVPVDTTSLFSSTVVTVPAVTGTIIPASALRTAPNGQVVVVLADGQEIQVTAEATVEGQAIVSGIDPGVTVRLPASPGS